MSFIATAVFKATIGLLINKARDGAAEKLKGGDVTDEKLRDLIVRKIDQINSKLDGLARKDLLSSISTFKEGIAILFDVFDKANKGVKELKENVTGQAAAAAATTEVSLQSSASTQAVEGPLANKLAHLQLIDLDESSKELLSDAKERFKEARSKATDAFSNEGLNTPDRILAMMIRVMATILEKADNPANALSPCRVCLEELHALPAVKNNFSIALGKGLKSRFGKDERKAIIAAVCDINHAIFDVTLMVSPDSLIFQIWPLIEVGGENVHPLRDPRVAELSQQNSQYLGYYPVQWSFGADILKCPINIRTNSKGEFIVGDMRNKNINVFDSNGKFSATFKLDAQTTVRDVAIDQADNVYVLFWNKGLSRGQVRVFDKDNNKLHCFGYDNFTPSRLAVLERKYSKKVFVVGERPNARVVVDVTVICDSHLLGEKLLWDGYQEVKSITTHDDRFMVLVVPAQTPDETEVHLFSAGGSCLHKFRVCHETNRLPKRFVTKAIHWENGHVIVASFAVDPRRLASRDVDVSIYTEEGNLVHHFVVNLTYKYNHISGIAISSQGRIALALCEVREKSLVRGEILVI